MGIINKDAVNATFDKLVGKGRDDVSRLQGSIDRVEGKVDKQEREYGATWRYFQGLGVFTDYLNTFLTSALAVRGGVAKSIYDAFDSAVSTWKAYTDSGVKGAREHADELHKQGVTHTNSVAENLSTGLMQQLDDLKIELESTAQDLGTVRNNVGESERRVLEEVTSRVQGVISNFATYKTNLARTVSDQVDPLERRVGELEGDVRYLVGKFDELSVVYGLPLRGRSQPAEAVAPVTQPLTTEAAPVEQQPASQPENPAAGTTQPPAENASGEDSQPANPSDAP